MHPPSAPPAPTARPSGTSAASGAAKVDVWWRENVERVRAYVYHHVPAADVEDVVQEVFVLALRRWAVVPEPPIGWLLNTARNVVANHHRGGRRFRGMLGRVAEAESRTARVDSHAGEQAARHELDALLDGLSANDREVLTMTAWYGLTAAEAAEALGISTNAYAVRLHRARARLAQSAGQGEEVA